MLEFLLNHIWIAAIVLLGILVFNTAMRSSARKELRKTKSWKRDQMYLKAEEEDTDIKRVVLGHRRNELNSNLTAQQLARQILAQNEKKARAASKSESGSAKGSKTGSDQKEVKISF